MKKIIKGKVYDTETAKKFGEWSNGYIVRNLYHKKTGEFFLHFKGPTLEKIIPLTYKEAENFAREKLDFTTFMAIFGEPSNNGEKRHLHIEISNVAYIKAKQEAAKRGITLAAYIESLI